jgi:ABC-type multidrug transport system ATPase subunit
MAERFDLPLTRKVRGYSHGMKRQLCFAAALAPDVRLRILDEITDGLDPSRRGQVLDALREDADSGTTLLLSSHHLGEVDRACDRMIFLNEGELIADESPASVLERTSRLVHLTYAKALTEEQLARLQGPTVERVHPSGEHVSVWISDSDPREFLASLAQHTDLQSPRRIEYGSLSLSQMYTDIYGVRGV